MLSVNNLSKIYKRQSNQLKALNNISFEVEKGEFISVVGRSGSGKSTLLNLIGGLDTPTNGEILFNGKNLHSMNRKDRELHRRFSIGMIFQSFNLIPYRSALDNVALSMIFAGYSKKKRRERAEELLDIVGLSQRAGHKPSEMSGGENQRVAIARALANKPMMLLADEPTGNLDSQTSDKISSLLTDLNKNQGITILMITHENEIAEAVSDRIITLLDGKIQDIRNMEAGNEVL